jgi:hypothetical protein
MLQRYRVLKHIYKFGSISPRDAFMDYGITRLAARIHDLKKEGYEFEVERKKHKETGVSYARYKLKSEYA